MRTLAIVVLPLAIAAAPVPKSGVADWKPVLKDRKFDFDRATKAWHEGLTAATKAGLQFELPTEDGPLRPGHFTFTRKGDPKFTVAAHAETPFAVRGDVLYVANFCQIATGCEIAAYDLTTGKQAWKQRLQGLGPIGHSKYRNRVAMSIERHPTVNDAFALVVTGWESSGGYIEAIDPGTGKQLAHKRFSTDELP